MRVIVLMITATVVFSACGSRPAQTDLPHSTGNSSDHSGTRDSILTSSANASAAPYELQFIDTMIAMNDNIIDAAQLVQTRSGQDALKAFAGDVIQRRCDETERLRAIRAKYFAGSAAAINDELPGANEAVTSLDRDKLDDLKEAPFDDEFAREIRANLRGESAFLHDAAVKLGSAASPTESADALSRFVQIADSARSAEIGRIGAYAQKYTPNKP